MSVSATARFTVIVDIPLGSWNEAEKLAELRVIASREGTAKLRSQLQKVDFKIIGEPKLVAMMAADDR